MSGCRIFIGRLNPSAREKDVERFFKGYGRIRDIDLKRGFGFVEFDDPRDAEDAVYELDGKELCNERVTIEHARVRLRGGRGGRGGGGGGGSGGGGGGRFPGRYSRGSQDSRRNPPPMRTENRLIVENLSSRVSWQDLKDFMRQAGEVTFADAHRPKLNEGVVEFASHNDLKNAMEKLSGKEINGRKIKLVEASRKKSRTRSRSNSSSRSRSRSRGRSASRSRSRSRSHSPKSHNHSRSRSRSASPSPVRPKEAARAESASPPTPAPRPPASRSPASRSPSVDSRH
ncbi:serine and arginine rich splicing factor 5b [Pimephales promelas]|uniref:serine and arginine rich splicing factor 5b n=1 Tax=Pimephales promelas TaxID=90988 RepID=UPI001955BFC5|nr:serine and arginine rich splicing factor 5b [Pimephales promelas]KAG1964160.1 serine/arginine-rich splicing factor [Pimephales promelas]KAG1964161.1 serine/arginine-rich splicing factor [Pimephales promelas]